MLPTMFVVAGPPGSGKSSLFRPDESAMVYFNADERARDLNGGSGHRISLEIRSVVNQELESFIVGHVKRGDSFCYETTLRTTVTFEQARLAKQHGFETSMLYVAVSNEEEAIQRVRARAEQGGHSAPPERIRAIYRASLKNLPRALNEFDYVQVFDNSGQVTREGPVKTLVSVASEIVYLAPSVPEWLLKALHGTPYEIE